MRERMQHLASRTQQAVELLRSLTFLLLEFCGKIPIISAFYRLIELIRAILVIAMWSIHHNNLNCGMLMNIAIAVLFVVAAMLLQCYRFDPESGEVVAK
jgi:hypothetical protein